MVAIRSYKVPGLKKETFEICYIERDLKHAREKGLPSTGYYGCQWNCVIEGGLIGDKTLEEAEKWLGINIKHRLGEQREDISNDMRWMLEDIDKFYGGKAMYSKFREITKYQKKRALLEESIDTLKSKGLSAFAV